jgi:hypothetical protein
MLLCIVPLNCFWICEEYVKDPAGLAWFCTPQVINAVKSRINQNPVRKQKIIAWEMDISLRTTSCIIKQDLGLSNNKQDNALLLH